jgi:tetratricopeptide (TPR) repeat protein
LIRRKLVIALLLAVSGAFAFSAQGPQQPTADQIDVEAVHAIAAGHLDKAIGELRRATLRFPDNRRIQLHLGWALVQKGQLREALVPLQKARQDRSLAHEARFLLGADYFESKQYSLATQELRGLQDSDHSERVLYMLEESNRRTGHVEEAKAAFHELISRYPDSAWTHYLMATAYEDQQKLDLAIDEYKQSLQKDPTIPNADFAIGYLYWRQQDNENARKWLKKETLRGCHGLANYYLGEIARTEGELGLAEASYRRSLACDPSNQGAHMHLGMVLQDQKHYGDAIRQFKEAIRLEPNESSAHYHLGSVYKQLGRMAEASAEYRKVREIQSASDKGTDVTRTDR